MKRRLLALAISALVATSAGAAEPAELSLYLFDEGRPVADAEVQIDAAPRGRTSSDGALNLRIEPGARSLRVLRAGAEVLSLELNLVEDEDAQIIATLYPDAAPSVFIESTNAGAAAVTEAKPELGPPGRLSGRVFNSEDGKPVAGARVYVSGTPIDLVSDAEGRFSAEIAPGIYAISVLAPSFASRSFEGIAIASEQTTEQAIELTPAGVELPEFVVLEPFIEGSLASFVEERRTSSAVTDILGAEQISRAGDSDAAGALKRVTGLTLVDGKFVYVRGLGERYSSVLINGAQVPSPDPTRRVVPLDLFPTEILNGIVVQKTYTADMPGEFGGGTIQLRTRGVPESFLLRASATVGWADGTTGDDGLRYTGGGRDWSGFDDGAREAPAGLLDGRLPSDPQALEALGEGIAAQGFNIRPKQVGPNTGFSFSVGDDLPFADNAWSLGYILSTRYSQNWDTREEQRATYSVLGNGQLVPLSDFDLERTERAIDAGLFFSTGLKIGEHHSVTGTAFQVRQTTDQAQISEGIGGSGNDEQNFELEWIENELTTRQLTGEHVFTSLSNLLLNWQYTNSRAQRVSPARREYRFQYDSQDERYEWDGSLVSRFEGLIDDAEEARVDFRLPLQFGEHWELAVFGGAGRLERERDSFIRRFGFRGSRPPNVTDLESVFTPERIRPGGLFLIESTQAADSYTAAQTLDSAFLGVDLGWKDWRLNLGAREERNVQEVVNQPPFNPNAAPVVGRVEADDLLPAGALTWAYSEKAQLRLAYSETVSRPDLRELSPADFIDPLLDVRVQGNPQLQQAQIESVDLRWEYYFSPSESFSVALFQKDFVNPIELVQVPASDQLLGLRNAREAVNRGVEFDLYKSLDFAERIEWLPGFLRGLPLADVYVGANYAWIESEIDLGDQQGTQTNSIRPLQGQSPYVLNLSLSYQKPDGATEATLLYNVSGERISRVGDSGLPDIYEQPFGQLDFTLSQALPWEGWKLKLRLRNLLDPDVEFLQGDQPTNLYRKGREAALSVEWKF
jgi:hypothetical protein